MIDKKVEQIIYCYCEYQPIFQEIEKRTQIQFIEGFPAV